MPLCFFFQEVPEVPGGYGECLHTWASMGTSDTLRQGVVGAIGELCFVSSRDGLEVKPQSLSS